MQLSAMRQLLEPLRLLPILKLTVGFSLGVVLAEEVRIAWYYLLPLFAVGSVCMVWGIQNQRYSRRWLFGAGVMATSFFIGAGYANEVKNQRVTMDSAKDAFVTIQVDENPIKTRYGYRWVSRILDTDIEVSNLAGTRAVTYYRGSNRFSYGDVIRASCRIAPVDPPKNPYEFSFKEYYARQGIYTSLAIAEGEALKVGRGTTFFLVRWAKNIQKFTVETFQKSRFERDELGVLVALMIGDKQFLDEDLKTSYTKIGAMHILAVSGMHVALVYGVLMFLLLFIRDRRFYLYKNLIVLCLLWLYAFVAGFSPSIVRATVMFSFILAGRLMDRDSNTFNMVAASFLTLLLINPLYLYDVGFQLSYAAVASILLFYDRLKHFAPHQRILRMCYDLIAVSVAAQILTLPLVVYYFHQFPLVFLLTNIVLIPITTLVIYCALLYLVSSGWSFGAFYMEELLRWLLNTSNSFARNLESLPNAVVSGIYISRWQMVVLMISFLLGYLYLLHRSAKILLATLSLVLIVLSASLLFTFTSEKDRLVVYSFKGGSAILLAAPPVLVSLCDSVRDLNTYKFMEPSVTRWRLGRLENIRFVKFDTTLQWNGLDLREGWCSFKNKIVYILSVPPRGKISFTQKVEVDLLVVSRRSRWKPEVALKVFAPKLIVADASVSAYWDNRWESSCRAQGVPFFSVRKKGAFISFL